MVAGDAILNDPRVALRRDSNGDRTPVERRRHLARVAEGNPPRPRSRISRLKRKSALENHGRRFAVEAMVDRCGRHHGIAPGKRRGRHRLEPVVILQQKHDPAVLLIRVGDALVRKERDDRSRRGSLPA